MPNRVGTPTAFVPVWSRPLIWFRIAATFRSSYLLVNSKLSVIKAVSDEVSGAGAVPMDVAISGV